MRERQAEQHDQGLACRHFHWWHFYPGGRFRQRRGFNRTRRHRVCAVHGDGELEKRGIGIKGKHGQTNEADHLLSSKKLIKMSKILFTGHLSGHWLSVSFYWSQRLNYTEIMSGVLNLSSNLVLILLFFVHILLKWTTLKQPLVSQHSGRLKKQLLVFFNNNHLNKSN